MIVTKLNFYGIPVTINSDNHYFTDLLSQNLSYFSASHHLPIFFESAQKISIDYKSQGRLDFKRESQGLVKIGNNAYFSENKYLYLHGNLLVSVSHLAGDIRIKAGYCLPRDLYPRFKEYALNSFLLSKRNYFNLIRILILYPLFMLLEEDHDVCLLHGSGVDYDGKGVVFAGLASVGKSLLAAALTLDQDFKFCSDNFLLFDKKNIYGMPEFIRLSDDAKGRILNTSILNGPILTRHGRDYYIMPSNKISARVETKLLFVIRRAQSHFINEINMDRALDDICLANDHVREFPQHHLAGLSGFMRNRTKAIQKTRNETFRTMLNNVKLFELGLAESGSPAKDVIRLIRDVL